MVLTSVGTGAASCVSGRHDDDGHGVLGSAGEVRKEGVLNGNHSTLFTWGAYSGGRDERESVGCHTWC